MYETYNMPPKKKRKTNKPPKINTRNLPPSGENTSMTSMTSTPDWNTPNWSELMREQQMQRELQQQLMDEAYLGSLRMQHLTNRLNYVINPREDWIDALPLSPESRRRVNNTYFRQIDYSNNPINQQRDLLRFQQRVRGRNKKV